MYTCKLLINNNWVDSESNTTLEITSPWDNQVMGSISAASQQQAISAVDSAKQAFASWRSLSTFERNQIVSRALDLIEANKDSIVNSLSREIGKTEDNARSEVERSIAYGRLVIEAVNHMKGTVYYGDVTGKYARGEKTGIYTREPLGVVLAISSFNYPLNLSITKIAPALVSGNSVVFKPATQGAISAIEFYKYFVEAGMPAGVFNIVTGKSSEIGDALVAHPDVSLIAFTGSTNVGNHLREVSNGIPLLLELGGKDTAIVTNNADLEIAAEQISSGGFSYCGQRCTAQKLVIVYEEVADKLVELIMAKSRDLELNPMIDTNAADYISELIEDAKQKGASHVLEGERNNNHIKPNIFDNVTTEMRIFHEEQFGPILPIVRVKDEHEALEKYSHITYGLQGSVYTNDIEEAFRIADKMNVGTVQINARPDRGPDNFPFGGVKDSGQYMQGTIETIELMTRGKLTVVNLHKL